MKTAQSLTHNAFIINEHKRETPGKKKSLTQKISRENKYFNQYQSI